MTGSPAHPLPRWVHAVIATLLLASAVGAIIIIGPAYQERVLRGENDFLQLYAGAALVGSGNLYSIEAIKRVQFDRAGLWLHSVFYSRPPFYAALLRPLAALPYLSAYWVFQSINLICFACFVYIFLAKRHPEYLVWSPLFFPVLIAFVSGQDIMIAVLFCALSLILAGRGRDLAAGACLSLCLIKFHLFILVPFAILAHRRWRMLLGGVAGSAFWLGLSFVAGGAGWPAKYLALLRNPELHPELEKMPAIFGVLLSFGVARPVAVVLLIAVGLLFVLALFRMEDFESSVGLALAGGIVLSVHAYSHDCTLLLIAIPLLSGPSIISSSLRALLLSPIPYLATLGGKPWNVVLPLSLVAFSAAGLLERRKPGQPEAVSVGTNGSEVHCCEPQRGAAL